MITKEAAEIVYNKYYTYGIEHALQKTAGLSVAQYRKILSGGGNELTPLMRAMGERSGGQAGTLAGGLIGTGLGAGGGLELAKMMSENELLAAALGMGGGVGGAIGLGALGNIAGRRYGGAMGELSGALGGVGFNRSMNNFLADPLKRVPGIRG